MGKGGDGFAGAGVGGPAEVDAAGFAGGLGDGGGAAFGGGLFGVVGAVEDGADFGEDLGQVDVADAGELLEKASSWVGGDDAFDVCFELGDGAQQSAQQLNLGADQASQYVGWQSGLDHSRGSTIP